MMTHVPTFTQDAQSILDRYLGRVKSALRPHPSVDADEVERDIRGHIEAELAEARAPVTAERLGSVLDRLGSPNAWVPADDLAAWRRLLIHISSGPEDWRLAYLALGLFVLFPLAPPLLFVSPLLARAGLALLEERGEPAGARKWLLYPPLLFIYTDCDGRAHHRGSVGRGPRGGIAGRPLKAGTMVVGFMETRGGLPAARFRLRAKPPAGSPLPRAADRAAQIVPELVGEPQAARVPASTRMAVAGSPLRRSVRQRPIGVGSPCIHWIAVSSPASSPDEAAAIASRGTNASRRVPST